MAMVLALGPALLLTGAVLGASMYASAYNPGYQYVANPDNILGETDGLAACGDGGGNFAIVVTFAEYVTIDAADILQIVSSGFDQINSGVILVTDAGNQQLIQHQAITGTYSLEEWAGLELQAVYISAGNNGAGNCVDSVFFGDGGTPTPTPMPSATPAPIANACIPANLVPTATPYPVITPTPFGTRTPTATPPGGTPAPTATPIPQQFLSRANFQTSLDPWTTNGGVGWGSAPGADLQAGVAVLPFTAGSTITQTGSTQLTAPNDALILEHLGLPAPWRIAGDIRLSDGVPAGTHPYLQVFAWVDGGLGTGSWELVSNVQVNQAWSTWTALSTISQTRAIALRAVLGLSSITNPLGFIPQDYPDRSIWVDNLRVVAGRDYNSPFVIGLPVCAGSGGAFGPGTQYKSCAVTRQEVNVFTCETPSDLLNIGGWIGWLWCSLWKYFQWNDANTDQITALIERNAHHQPFAAASDLISSIYLIADAARAFAAMPAVADVGQPDFSNMLNARPLDQPLQLPMPALEDTGDDPMAVTRAACPQALLDISATLAPGACYAAYRIKQLGALTVIQWLFNIACWLWLGRWFYLLFANRTEL